MMPDNDVLMILTRQDTLFANRDGGAQHWAVVALFETCKLNAIGPEANLGQTTTEIGQERPQSRIDELLSWVHVTAI